MVESASSVQLTESEFLQLSSFIYKKCGINLSPAKKVLVESRLQKRLSALKLNSFSAYCQYVMGPAGERDELISMIDAVATNKTDFFREPMHFQFLKEEVLPELDPDRANKPFKIWSSACSSGEEPYTAAMVMEEFRLLQRLDYRITATDISTKILKKAMECIYPERNVLNIPLEIRRRYLLKSKDLANPTVRIVPALRAKVQFKRLNLIEDSWDVDSDYDVIFCRNVLIYFDKPTQEEVVRKLLTKLRTGGYLFIGHSESIDHMKLPVTQVKPTIFKKL